MDINELERQGLKRELKPVIQRGVYLEYQGKTCLNLSSNDYLGISACPELQREFFATLDADSFLMGALSSRLLTGDSLCAEELEAYLSTLYGRDCLLYNSGYHANVGILPAMTARGDLIVADRLVHASIIDGIRLCNCEMRRYRHNDYSDLERILQQNAGKYANIFIVTESIFSMDGDTADITTLAGLKERYGARLYIDEAHAFGLVGERGLGCVADRHLLDCVDFTVCTLGKAAASEGAFVLCSAADKQWLVNKSRTLIFTTAAPPINLKWTHFIVRKIIGMDAEREHLRSITAKLRRLLAGRRICGDSHIVPLIIGENDECVRVAEAMREKGVWAMPVRYPSVPAGQARIRLSLTAALTDKQIEQTYESIPA
jgi:8-amino-7-oxononanoate synthase